jgi:creatinine amidohydrolase/Fe(II)-dependent formamide hydrolase-like protein
MDLAGPAKGPRQFRGFHQHTANNAQLGPSEVHFFLDYNEIAEDASMGDVSSVTAEFGAEIFSRMIDYATEFVSEWMRTAPHVLGGQAHE